MSMTPIDWYNDKHRWALIRHYSNDFDVVSRHTTPHEAVLHCQKWIQGDPWTFPDGNDYLNHFYDVEARDRTAALELALARHQIAAEDAVAGRVSRFPRFDEPGGELLQPCDNDEPYEQTACSVPADQTPNGRCQFPRHASAGPRDDRRCERTQLRATG